LAFSFQAGSEARAMVADGEMIGKKTKETEERRDINGD